MGDEMSMCRQALYMELTGKTWKELPKAVAAAADDSLDSANSKP